MSAAGAAAVLGARPARAAGNPRVVIAGAGLAGLSCARALWQNSGIAASIYEWDDRIGGRVQTLRGYFADGISAEQHGQLISSEHVRMRALAATYGLTLANVDLNLNRNPDSGWFNGQLYSEASLIQDWRSYAWALFRDAVRAAPSASHAHANAQARIWDNMSVTDWVEQYIEGGVSAPLGALCLSLVAGEYGSAPELQSALNLVYILGYNDSDQSGYQSRLKPLLDGTDERYQVAGGNDQIITGLASDLPAGAINTFHQLLAVRPTPHGGFTCSFQNGSGVVDVAADHVVITLPPPPLRDVDLSRIGLTAVQRLALAHATLGTNAKIFLQVAGRPWITDGFSGTVLTDALVGGGWDAANCQKGGFGPHANGVFVGFPGGKAGATLAQRYNLTYGDDAGPAPPAMVADTLAQLEPIYPGMTAAWNAGPQKAWVNDGNIDPHLRGAYSNFLIGQYTAFGGVQGHRAGNLHFAGEHTSVQFQGFMEGAVQSGLRVANEITGAKRVG